MINVVEAFLPSATPEQVLISESQPTVAQHPLLKGAQEVQYCGRAYTYAAHAVRTLEDTPSTQSWPSPHRPYCKAVSNGAKELLEGS